MPVKSAFNLGTLLIISAIASTIIYIVVVIVLYFVFKKAWEKDDYKEMITSKYVKQSICGYLFAEGCILDFLYLLFRTTFMANSFVVTNPCDAMIVIFSIVVIIMGGYWIKYIYTTTKRNIARKRAIKLHLDLDILEDGTK